MNTGYRTVAVLIVVLLLVAAAYAIHVRTAGQEVASTATPTVAASSSVTPSTSASGSTQIEISGFAFSTTTLTVKKGTTVTWKNTDSVAHTVTKVGSSGPDSPVMQNGDTYTYTFQDVGTFKYICKFHTYMQGTVIVTE